MNKKTKVIIGSSVIIIGLLGVTQVSRLFGSQNINNEQAQNNQEKELENLSINEISALIEKNDNFKSLKKSKSVLEDLIKDMSDEKTVSDFEKEYKDINEYLDELIKLFDNKKLDEGSEELLETLNLAKENLNKANNNLKLSLEDDSESKDNLEEGIKEIMKSYLYINTVESIVSSSNTTKDLQSEIDSIEDKDLEDIKIPNIEKEEKESTEDKKEELKEEVKEEIKQESADNEEVKEEVVVPEKDYSYHKSKYRDINTELIKMCRNSGLVNDYLYQENYNPDINNTYYNELQNIKGYCEYWGADLWRDRECNNDAERAKEEKFRLSMKKIKEAIDTYYQTPQEDGKDFMMAISEAARTVIEQLEILESIEF